LGVEKRFVEDGFTKALINEYLTKELSRAGYGGMMMNRTPMGTQITVYAEKPGMVIGKGGKLIRKLTRDLDRNFRLDNPQIDVQDVGKSELNAQVVASRIASSLERGWYFRKAGQSMIRRIMESGALGCEIVLSGKLTGPRSRTEKFVQGYVKHSGKPSEELVDYGYAVAVKKLGTIGCQVRIVPPGVTPPDVFEITPPLELEVEVTPVEEVKDELDELLETETEVVEEDLVIEEGDIVEIVEDEEVPEDTAEDVATLVDEGSKDVPLTEDVAEMIVSEESEATVSEESEATVSEESEATVSEELASDDDLAEDVPVEEISAEEPHEDEPSEGAQPPESETRAE